MTKNKIAIKRQKYKETDESNYHFIKRLYFS